MNTFKLYLGREQLSSGLSKEITPVKKSDLLTDYDLASYTLGDLDVFGFSDHITSAAHLVLVNMTIPAFFDQSVVYGAKKEIHGLFMISLGDSYPLTKDFVEDNAIIGQFGCPKRVLLQSGKKSYFTWNKMRFYPFVMTDFSAGYYVCDDAGSSSAGYLWPDYNSETEKGVALDYPVTYDPTLGLYITRAAHIELKKI